MLKHTQAGNSSIKGGRDSLPPSMEWGALEKY